METRKPQKSTDRGGVGQSGYAAGRTDDPALEKDVQVHNDEGTNPTEQPSTDDRFIGKPHPKK